MRTEPVGAFFSACSLILMRFCKSAARRLRSSKISWESGGRFSRFFDILTPRLFTFFASVFDFVPRPAATIACKKLYQTLICSFLHENAYNSNDFWFLYARQGWIQGFWGWFWPLKSWFLEKYGRKTVKKRQIRPQKGLVVHIILNFLRFYMHFRAKLGFLGICAVPRPILSKRTFIWNCKSML